MVVIGSPSSSGSGAPNLAPHQRELLPLPGASLLPAPVEGPGAEYEVHAIRCEEIIPCPVRTSYAGPNCATPMATPTSTVAAARSREKLERMDARFVAAMQGAMLPTPSSYLPFARCLAAPGEAPAVPQECGPREPLASDLPDFATTRRTRKQTRSGSASHVMQALAISLFSWWAHKDSNLGPAD